jgi:cation:H+ antiporter
MEYIFLILGFFILLFSGKYLVKGSVALADHFRVSKLVIGVTVVSFGTSAPELFVSLRANLIGSPDIAVGNVMGSNIANIGLVLALTALVFPIPVRKNSVKIDAPFMLVISAFLYILIKDQNLGRLEGVLFLLILTAYVLFLIFKSRKEDEIEEVDLDGQLKLSVAFIIILLSAAGLAWGSHLLVENARVIAAQIGISERVISITVIAFGTSLPELVTSLIAAFKKEMDISIGNIIGSNIFNILAVLGVVSSVKPLAVEKSFISFDIFWMLGISSLLFVFILPFKGGKLTRIKGLVMFVIFLVYYYFLFLNK